MRMPKATQPVKHDRKKSGSKPRKCGKRSLYDPEIGTANLRKAEDGRFAEHPAFLALKALGGVGTALERMASNFDCFDPTTVAAVSKQMNRALSQLKKEAGKLETQSQKLSFAEAISAYSNHAFQLDQNVVTVLSRHNAITNWPGGTSPSQAELRRAVKERDHLDLDNQQWKRLLKRTGLNKLPTARQKANAKRS